MPPRISVIVPIYNAASTLRAAVQSILTQDIAGLEVLLVDDGSTDATPGLCHDLALRDDRVQVITQKNAGICAARNRGLSAAEGVYVTFCDDDDLLLPGGVHLLGKSAVRALVQQLIATAHNVGAVILGQLQQHL